MAKGKKVITPEPTKRLDKHGLSAGGNGARGRKAEAWPLPVAFDIFAQAVQSINDTGETQSNLPLARVRNVGSFTGLLAPCVVVAIEGAYYCETCHTLTFAATVGEAKCERCTGGENG